MTDADPLPRVRRALVLRGTVQGVGLRPALYRLALAHELSGFVQNALEGVRLEVEGAPDAVAAFLARLPEASPATATLLISKDDEISPRDQDGFWVAASASDHEEAAALGLGLIPPDLAPCEACLRELEDPRDRRYRYPFSSCTACGPRFTVVESLPYDRARTTLAPFLLCDACRVEYEDPSDRRFHAEAIACPACGPTLSFVEGGRQTHRGQEALDAAIRRLKEGAIVAVKGAGGFSLACDATCRSAVAELRQRKLRPHKPFAVMVRDLSYAERIAVLSDDARRALLSAARPIVLAPARRDGPLAAEVAPRLTDVGLFLPPTPLQHLLLLEGPPLQVMTSGNVSDEPLVKDNDEALTRLVDIADALLLHDRVIAMRADDSVVRAMPGGTTPIRRARGYVPRTFRLSHTVPTSVLAVGGEMKSTLCLARGDGALLTAHLGNLRQPDAYRLFRRCAEDLLRLAGGTPAAVAHDLHPEYRSTRFALELGLPLVSVQHHHAHIASCLVEHGRSGPVIGIAFDGTGYGDDGSLWGGEALIADLLGYQRAGHLRPLELLGGERAIREPWRLALAALHDAGEPASGLHGLVDDRRLSRAATLLGHRIVTPRATGAGRWFDAVAALCGLCADVSYDGQAAAELEALAVDVEAAPYELALEHGADGSPFVVDLRPAVRQIAADRRREVPLPLIAARFHETLARAVLEMALRAREQSGIGDVVLTGGCFQNRRLTTRSVALLGESGFGVLLHQRAPPNDGGLSLGQAAVAATRLAAQDGASCA